MNGLYKKISDTELLFAQQEIFYPNGLNIHIEQFDEPRKEINGWRMFESRKDALEFYNINENIEVQ